MDRIKYLCYLGHKKYTNMPEYGKWQRRVIKKYGLWSFSRIEPDQVEKEIKILDEGQSSLF